MLQCHVVFIHCKYQELVRQSNIGATNIYERQPNFNRWTRNLCLFHVDLCGAIARTWSLQTPPTKVNLQICHTETHSRIQVVGFEIKDWTSVPAFRLHIRKHHPRDYWQDFMTIFSIASFLWRQIWINWGGVWVEPTQLRVSHLSFSNRSHRSPVCKKGNSNWLIQLIYFCGKTSSVHVFVICNGASSCGPFFSGVLCLVVVPPLWCTIKHPINYSMDEFCKNVHMVKFCGRPNVSSSTAMRLTFVVFREISQQLLDGMPWTLIQTSNNLVYIQIPANYSRSHQLQLLFSAN